MRQTIVSIFALAFVSVAGGCNALLDIQPGEYVDGGADTSGGDSGVNCAAAQKLCKTGQCRADDDPGFGCGSTDCAACNLPHAIPTCGGGAGGESVCTIDKAKGALGCEDGWGDCNGKPEDGCELSLAKKSDCGACGARCEAVAPFCAKNGTKYECTATCLSPKQVCGQGECVDVLTDGNHCGACDHPCTVKTGPSTGSASCGNGVCKVVCAEGFHKCAASDSCYRDDDALHCGSTCVVCTGGKVCGGGTCACPPSAPFECNGSCSATPCTVACGKGEVACGKTCCVTAKGQDCCAGRCIDVLSDNANCGGCSVTCPSPCICSNRSCVSGGAAGGPVAECGIIIAPPPTH